MFAHLPRAHAGLDGPGRGLGVSDVHLLPKTLILDVASIQFGKSTITDGKVDGDNLSFTIVVKFQDNEMKLNYKGKVSGNEIKFTVESAAGGNVIEWLAKKVS